jgi:hypothetical protein
MTTETIFSAVLTLSLLAGGAVAFGSDAARTPQAPAMVATATLPTVTVVGQRVAAAEATLPTVTVIGHRAAAATVAKATLPTVTVVGRRVAPTAVAIETESVEQRVQ